MLDRLRLALQQGSLEKVGGEVEADETFIGVLAKNLHKSGRARRITGTGSKDKGYAVGLLARKAANHPSRVLLTLVENRTLETVQDQVRQNLESGAGLNTDASHGYKGLDVEYVHQAVDHAVEYASGSVHTNGTESFWRLLRWTIKGTHVSVDPVHLTRYPDQQSVRFNERGGNDRPASGTGRPGLRESALPTPN